MKSHINIISVPLLVEQLKRFWVIAVLPMIIYILTVVVPVFNSNARDAASQTRNIVMVLSMSHPALIIGMILVPFVVVMALYPYLFNDRATTAFYSFPVTRGQLFFTNFVAGTILMLAPIIILTLILLIPVGFNANYNFNTWGGTTTQWSSISLPNTLFCSWLSQGDTVNTFGRVMGFFLRTTIGFMFYFAVFLVAISVAGNRVVAVLLAGLLPFIPLAVYGLYTLVGELYVFGMSPAATNSVLESILYYSNPASWAGIISNGGSFSIDHSPQEATSLLSYTLVYIGVGLALLGISYFSSVTRRVERTGDSVVFNGLKNVLIFILSTAGMILGAAAIGYLTRSRAGWHIGAAIGFALAYFIAQMVAEKAFNIFRTKTKYLLYFGGAMLVLYLGMVLFTGLGMSFYTNRIPPLGQISHVSFDNQWTWNRSYVRGPEIITQATAIHNEILANRSNVRSARWSSMFTDNWSNYREFNITYVLQNGRRVNRTYTLTAHMFMELGINELMHHPAVVIARHPFLDYPEIARAVVLQSGDLYELGLIATRRIYIQDMVPFLQAVRTDFMRDMMYTLEMIQNVDALLELSPAAEIELRQATSSEPGGRNLRASIDVTIDQEQRERQGIITTRSQWLSFRLFEDGETLAWLIANGYVSRLD